MVGDSVGGSLITVNFSESNLERVKHTKVDTLEPTIASVNEVAQITLEPNLVLVTQAGKRIQSSTDYTGENFGLFPENTELLFVSFLS